jgi:hypothetical protein
MQDKTFGFTRLVARHSHGGTSLGLAALPTARSKTKLEHIAALLRAEIRVNHRAAQR